jgi:hypothetical protein
MHHKQYNDFHTLRFNPARDDKQSNVKGDIPAARSDGIVDRGKGKTQLRCTSEEKAKLLYFEERRKKRDDDFSSHAAGAIPRSRIHYLNSKVIHSQNSSFKIRATLKFL